MIERDRRRGTLPTNPNYDRELANKQAEIYERLAGSCSNQSERLATIEVDISRLSENVARLVEINKQILLTMQAPMQASETK